MEMKHACKKHQQVHQHYKCRVDLSVKSAPLARSSAMCMELQGAGLALTCFLFALLALSHYRRPRTITAPTAALPGHFHDFVRVGTRIPKKSGL